MCRLGAVSRASYYRHSGPQAPKDEEESDLRDAIQRMRSKIAPTVYDRGTHARGAQGCEVNQRVARLMRLDNLLPILSEPRELRSCGKGTAR